MAKQDIEKAFISFTKKSVDELTAKEEDFLLEQWREDGIQTG